MERLLPPCTPQVTPMLPDVPKERTVSIFRVMSPWTDPQPWRRRRDFASKLQEHITEQHGATTQRSAFSTVKRRKPQITVFLLLRICFVLIISSSSCIIVFFLGMTDFLWKHETVQVIVAMGRNSFSGGKVDNTVLRNYCEATLLFERAFLKNWKKGIFFFFWLINFGKIYAYKCKFLPRSTRTEVEFENILVKNELMALNDSEDLRGKSPLKFLKCLYGSNIAIWTNVQISKTTNHHPC